MQPAANRARAVALERGSNFRDLGGYVGANGRSIVWGRLFRSGGLTLLTEGDYQTIERLGLSTVVDLRAVEERQLAPSRVHVRVGARYLTSDYAVAPIVEAYQHADPGRTLYEVIERTLAPIYRELFAMLIAGDGPLLFHCSGGQDRTGVVAALILTALGVDRATVVDDYHLSTSLRRPDNEFPNVIADEHPGNAVANIYALAQLRPGDRVAEPLFAADGTSHIVRFFAYLESTYGGFEHYLQSRLGVGSHDILQLRRMYLK